MEITVSSPELVDALCRRIGELTAELETTKIALDKAQELLVSIDQRSTRSNEIHPVL